MNKRAEVEGFMPMVLVKLIFALLLILLITWLLVSLWTAIFGSENKTEKDNFETLFKLIDSKSKSVTEFDSSRLTVYLITTGFLSSDHTIHFFAPNDITIKCAKGEPINRPSDCDDNTKACLCLYDSNPDRDEEDKDDEVIVCEQFTESFKIAPDDFQLANYSDDCSRSIDNEYMQLIVGVQNSNNNKRVFVWQNTPENRALIEQMQKKECPNTAGACKDKKDSEVITDLKTVNDACKSFDPNKIYSQVKCVLENNMCKVECTGDPCSSTQACRDFNIDKDFYTAGSKEEYSCKNNPCGKQCSANLIEQYSCITGKEQECKDLINDITFPGFVANCSVVIGPYSSLTVGAKNYNAAKMIEVGDIIGFDSTRQNTENIDCQTEIEKSFKKYPVRVCIPGKNCNDFVTNNPNAPDAVTYSLNNCQINPQKAGNNIFITKQDVICVTVNEYFTDAYTCDDIPFAGGGGKFGGAGATGKWP